MLRDEFLKYQDQISRLSRKQNRKLLGHFKEIQFTQADWMKIKHLNDELQVRNYIIFVDLIQMTDKRFVSLSIFLPRKWRAMVLPVLLCWPITIKQ